MFKTMGYSPGLLLKIGQFSTLTEFTLNRHKQSRKQSQIILEWFWRRFREFGAISRICQNRPCSKPWAIAQAFCSKSANFRPLFTLNRHKQSRKPRAVFQAFQRVWIDFQDFRAIAQAFCSKSATLSEFTAMFKWAAFCSKSPIFDPSEFTLNRRASSHKSF